MKLYFLHRIESGSATVFAYLRAYLYVEKKQRRKERNSEQDMNQTINKDYAIRINKVQNLNSKDSSTPTSMLTLLFQFETSCIYFHYGFIT
jgi:hypothetical protein